MYNGSFVPSRHTRTQVITGSEGTLYDVVFVSNKTRHFGIDSETLRSPFGQKQNFLLFISVRTKNLSYRVRSCSDTSVLI